MVKIGEKCVIYPARKKEFVPYKTYIKNLKNNIIEVELYPKANLSSGKNIIVELIKNNVLIRFKGTVRRTGKTTMLCAISKHSEKDRQFTRADISTVVTFKLWSNRKEKLKGLITNISGNGIVLSTKAKAYLGELILIEDLKLKEEKILNDINGRVIKFKLANNNDEGYNEMVVNFTYITEADRNKIIKYVNSVQKRLKEKDKDDENFDELSFLDDYY